MKGDFSRWNKVDEKDNFCGVMHQQGRVLLDEDWNAQARITNHWQDTAARDTIGPGVAAVPADDHNAFKITNATAEEGEIKLTLSPGRIWADGLLVHLKEEIELVVPYLEPPIQFPVDNIAESGTRDAVVLEVWREAVNGFQDPATLIESALGVGGPDTTERVHTAMALRLLRLGTGQACENIRNRLTDDFNSKGKLTVSLQPTIDSEDVCPQITGGGYVGFEHHLYRIEIAEVDEGAPMFKWSQFNGGLVGRGEFHIEGEARWFRITHNDQAIKNSGLDDSFYLEALKFDEHGHWRVVYGATVVLDGDNLQINENEEYFRAELPTGSSGDGQNGYFFRLWNNIESVASFTSGEELKDGILLQFTEPIQEVAVYYKPGDFWTFQLRAGLTNKETIISNQPPQGIDYHRVPLAALHWGENNDTTIVDCRLVFPPLTKQKVCCSYTVGDGFSSHGDYDSIQEAIDKLPLWGGEIHLLPGIHRACVTIENKFNLTVKGCDLRTIILPGDQDISNPIFRISNSWYIKLEHLWLANAGRTAVDVDSGHWIELAHNIIFSFQHALRFNGGRIFNIHDNTIRMWDRLNGDVAIYFAANDGLIERNNIAVIPWATRLPAHETEGPAPNPADECEQPESIENDPKLSNILRAFIKSDRSILETENSYRALGGIQIAGDSERVLVRDNWIHGGDGNGITLGTGYVIPSIAEPEISESVSSANIFQLKSPFHKYLYGKVTLNDVCLDEEIITISISEMPSVPSVPVQKKFTTTNMEYEEAPGWFIIKDLSPNVKYVMFIDTPGYEIESIVPIEEQDSSNNFKKIQRIEVKVRREEEEQNEESGFLYDITIENNRITRMGLCGIGASAGLPGEQEGETREWIRIATNQTYSLELSNPVVRLQIKRNRIANCLQNPSKAIDTIGSIRGLGGISLGMCESLTIRGNRIENNGRDFCDPVCGIFAKYSALANISDNYIANNSPLNTEADPDNILPGIRGGVVLEVTKSITFEGWLQTTRPTVPSVDEEGMPPSLANAVQLAGAMGGYAARIHDNLIKQPLMHALNMKAWGPVSVANNQLITDFSGEAEASLQTPATNLRSLAGTVFIQNIGHSYSISLFTKDLQPSGSIIFSDNHIRLGCANTLTSIIIISADDIAFENNHSDIMEDYHPILINTVLSAMTVRATGNRMQEKIAIGKFFDKSKMSTHEVPKIKSSLLTYGILMNTTANNQGNHCVTLACSYQDVIVGALTNHSIISPPHCCPVKTEDIKDLLLKHTIPFYSMLNII